MFWRKNLCIFFGECVIIYKITRGGAVMREPKLELDKSLLKKARKIIEKRNYESTE